MAKNKLYKNIYCIIGPSGSGKTTAADLLESKWRRRILKSYTTRPKRHKDDSDHTYITEEEYDSLTEKVAVAEIGGYRYCATAGQIDAADYYIVDWDGFDGLLDNYKGKKRSVCVIYLSCPEDVCRQRMAARGDSEEAIARRIAIDRMKFSRELYERHSEHILKTINTGNITAGVVAGVINAVAGKLDRKIK